MSQMINVNGVLVNPDAKFVYNNGFGETTITALQASALQFGSDGARGSLKRSGGNSWTSYDGYLDLVDAGTAPKPAAAPAPAPAPAPAAHRSAPRPSSSGSGNRTVDQVFKELDQYAGKEANDAVKGDPYGIEDTRITPTAAEVGGSEGGGARVQRSFLTNQKEAGGYSYHQVVDPASGKVFESAAAAKDAGITNWVYKFQYDRKRSQENLIGDLQSPNAPAQGSNVAAPDESTYAQAGIKWRDRYSTNRWFA